MQGINGFQLLVDANFCRILASFSISLVGIFLNSSRYVVSNVDVSVEIVDERMSSTKLYRIFWKQLEVEVKDSFSFCLRTSYL